MIIPLMGLVMIVSIFMAVLRDDQARESKKELTKIQEELIVAGFGEFKEDPIKKVTRFYLNLPKKT